MKLDRSTFLYLEPHGAGRDFAQCATCELFRKGNRCAILGPDVPVYPDSSCGFYIPGKPDDDECRKTFTPAEVGLVHRQVRCENCISYEGGTCELFAALNKSLPEQFNLDTSVKPRACCNAQRPKADERTTASAAALRYAKR